MSIGRHILRPVAFVAGLHASRQARSFLAAHDRTAQVQERLLREMLRRHASTAFGCEHGFDRIRGYADFVSAVPIRTYDRLRAWMDRVFEGDTAALLPPGDDVLMFSQTSGTTGSPKHVPVTRRFLDSMRRGWNIFGMLSFGDHRDAWLRKILQISSPMNEGTSPRGKPCGAVSGLLAATQKRIVRRMYPVPALVSGMRDALARYYTILRCGVTADVAVVTTANPSTTIKLIETGQAHAARLVRDVADGAVTPPGDLPPEVRAELRFRPRPDLARRMEQGIARDGTLLPRHFWRISVLYNWTGGTLGLYLPRLRELFDGAPVRDIGLLASEGRFSIPLADNTPAGVAEIQSNVLEFMPVEERDSASPAALPAHQAQVGQEYFLVVTNWAGLWRYNIDDRVRVIGRLGQSPVFEFLSRGLHTASITGEKLTEHQAVEAMAQAAAACGLAVDRFTLTPHFAATPYYELLAECPDEPSARRLAAAMDEALARLNVEYKSKRQTDRLGPVRPRLAAAGTFADIEARHIAARRGRAEQYKHRYLLTEVVRD